MTQMEHYQKIGDQVGLRAPHRTFHHTLVAAAGPRMSAEISELADYAERYRLRFGAAAGAPQALVLSALILFGILLVTAPLLRQRAEA